MKPFLRKCVVCGACLLPLSQVCPQCQHHHDETGQPAIVAVAAQEAKHDDVHEETSAEPLREHVVSGVQATTTTTAAPGAAVPPAAIPEQHHDHAPEEPAPLALVPPATINNTSSRNFAVDDDSGVPAQRQWIQWTPPPVVHDDEIAFGNFALSDE